MHYTWQDLVLAASLFGFNVALLPSIFSKHKPALTTSLLTALFQLAGFAVYINLALWYSAAMSFVNFTLWSILSIQKLKFCSRAKSRY